MRILSFFKRSICRDALIICLGCLIFAVGMDCFEIGNGLSAGGAAGLSMSIRVIVQRAFGITLPVGGMVLLMNVFLMIPVIKTGGLRYAARTVIGIVASSVFIDLLEPVLPVLGDGDLLLCALWGGVICGIGLGIVFKVGGNTGGTDIVAQLLQRVLPVSSGVTMFVVDALVVVISIPVFGLVNGLYAAVAMYLTSYAIDRVVDGFSSQRAAYIISDKGPEIAQYVLHVLDRGCTEISAKGSFSQQERPMLLVVVPRTMTADLKEGVSKIDPDAIVFITDVYEAYGEGFNTLRN
ncbi:MAG: YitT family protein [Atopobiaceae bacterium]|jgi:uncharacterized membrane-anchored protein YitT (DUF2179 family)